MVGFVDMRTGFVYVLVDVRRPYDYRYVGKTVALLRVRLARHKRTATNMPHLWVARWITKVGPRNVRIIPLGEYPEGDLPFRECQWMATLREAGHELTNIAHGGSAAGFPAGYYRHTPDTIARMVRSNKGQTRSAETRAAIAAGNRRRFKDPAERRKVATAWTPEQRKQASARWTSEMRAAQAERTRKKRNIS
jgi:hypothetical protein